MADATPGTPIPVAPGGFGRSLGNIITTNLFPVRKHELVEVLVPAGTTKTRFYLPDLQNLRNVKIQNLEVLTIGEVAISPTGNVPASLLQASQSYITLQGYNGKEFLHQQPLLPLHYVFSPTNITQGLQKQFTNQRVNYPKCYIEFFGGVPAVAFSFLFSVYYVDMTPAEMNQANTFNNKG
jgi:hypothetical protein